MNAKPIQMLLVEDSASDAQLILESLSKDGLNEVTYHVRDGVEALDFVFGRGAYAGRAHEPPLRVIVLDVKLPKVDGFEVLAELRADERTQSIPVVMLTSSNIARDVERGRHLGVNSYVQKPVDFERFRETVRLLGVYWITMNEPAPAASARRKHND
jgi:CheY-like chemotaxis protein